MRIKLTKYDREFLSKSWEWLTDPEIKQLTMTPDFTQEDQEHFFSTLPKRTNYKIWGVETEMGLKIGCVGIKNITEDRGQYWGYIGEKEFWGLGIGKTMVRLMEQHASNMGLKVLYLTVSSANERAIKLYLHCGFRQISNNSGIITMEKVL